MKLSSSNIHPPLSLYKNINKKDFVPLEFKSEFLSISKYSKRDSLLIEKKSEDTRIIKRPSTFRSISEFYKKTHYLSPKTSIKNKRKENILDFKKIPKFNTLVNYNSLSYSD